MATTLQWLVAFIGTLSFTVAFSHTPTTYFMASKETSAEGLLNKLKLYLKQYYEPVYEPQLATLQFTTTEIYEQLQKLFPIGDYSIEDVAVWLHEAGFTFFDFGEMCFEWVMKKALV